MASWATWCAYEDAGGGLAAAVGEFGVAVDGDMVTGSGEAVAAFFFFFLMPPLAEVVVSGHTPCALKYSTAHRAASCLASFFDAYSDVREPKGESYPSMVAWQAKWLPLR